MAILKLWDEDTSTWFEVPIEDPTLYMRHDGSVAMTGDLDMGAKAITNVGNVDGRDVSADGVVLDAHIADTTDPHGSTMGVSVQLTTPLVHVDGQDLYLETNDVFQHRTVYVRNPNATYQANLDVERNILIGGGASYDALYDNGDVNGAITIDWLANGNVQKMTLTGNVTSLAFTNPPGPCNCRLWIHQDGTGGRTIAGWDADVDWGGSAPVVSAGASKFNIGVFEYNGGSIYASQLVQGIDGTGFG